MEPEVVTDIINKISDDFGELPVTRGNKHTFFRNESNHTKG